MSEKNCFPEIISGSLLHDSQARESLQALLQPEVLQVTGYNLILQPHLSLLSLLTFFNIDNHKVILYVPEQLSFSLTDLKEKLFTTYNELKTRSNTTENKSLNVGDMRKKLNNKN